VTKGAAIGPTGRGILLMLTAIVIFTLMDAIVKGLVDRYPVSQIVWARVAGQLVLVLLILRGASLPMARTRHPWLHLFRALTQLGASGFFFASLLHIGLAEATALADINPILITLGAAIFLGERLGPRRIAGVMTAMVGALIIIRPGLGVFSPWSLLPLAGACCYAANALITRHVGPRESVWTSMILGSVICTAIMSVVMPFTWAPVQAADLPAFAAVGVLGTLAQVCIVRSFTLAEASVVAPFTYLGIIMATFWGWLFYGDLPDAATVFGAVVIVAAGLYVWHRETRATHGTERTG
jgi:drug/metabolite transporter (DMT)-like permease